MRGSLLTGVLCLAAACGSSQPEESPAPATTTTTTTAPGPAEQPVGVGAPGPAQFNVDGAVAGKVVADAELVVVWTVWTGDPDRMFIHGDAMMKDDGFHVSLPGTPPPASINDMTAYGMGKLAVGMIAALAPGTRLPAGDLADRDAFKDALIGWSASNAIIWREGSFDNGKIKWPSKFPEGAYACGACAPTGGTFDAFEPGDCGKMTVVFMPLHELRICNFN